MQSLKVTSIERDWRLRTGIELQEALKTGSRQVEVAGKRFEVRSRKVSEEMQFYILKEVDRSVMMMKRMLADLREEVCC